MSASSPENSATVPTVNVHAYGLDLKGSEPCMFDSETGRITQFATKPCGNDRG